MKRGLTTIQLKIIATFTMILGYMAWAASGVFTPAKSILQLIGNLSLPIMCFFIAEGYRHTANLEKYINRIVNYWVISIYPYYLYMGKLQIRQNAVFDMFLALLALALLEAKKLPVYIKIPGILFISLVSVFFGGWIIVPILLTLLFYYTNKWHVQLIGIGCIVLSSIACAYLASMLGVTSQGNWVLQEKWYMLGFLLSVPLIRLYNGKFGAIPYAKFFFYILYPAQFLIIAALFQTSQTELHQYYIYLHVVVVFNMVSLGYYAITAKPSKVQTSNVLLNIFVFFYMIGYFIELTTFDLETAKVAIKIEYLGITGVAFGFTWFVDEYCQIGMKKIIYILEWVFSGVVLICVFWMDTCKLFFRDFTIHDYGKYSLVTFQPGILYRLFFLFFTVMVIMIERYCWRVIRSSTGVRKIRCELIFLGILAPAIPACAKWSGLRKGYDFMTFGAMGFLFFFTVAMIEYDSINGIQTEAEKDSLTGISNRSYYVECVDFLLRKQSCGTMLMLDMDNFKQVNDQYGHKTGDKVLTLMGKTLQEVVDNKYLSCRLGGDEFSVFLENETHTDTILEITNNIMQEFEKRLKEESLKLTVGLSIGIAVYTGEEEETLEGLYEKADKALYVAKNSGKRQCQFYH